MDDRSDDAGGSGQAAAMQGQAATPGGGDAAAAALQSPPADQRPEAPPGPAAAAGAWAAVVGARCAMREVRLFVVVGLAAPLPAWYLGEITAVDEAQGPGLLRRHVYDDVDREHGACR